MHSGEAAVCSSFKWSCRWSRSRWQSVGLLHVNGMTLQWFYSRWRVNAKKRGAASSSNVPCGKPSLPEMQIQFPGRGKRANMCVSLWQPHFSAFALVKRLVLCDRVNSCWDVEAQWPGRQALPVCCSASLAWNLMSVFLPSVCTRRPSGLKLGQNCSRLSVKWVLRDGGEYSQSQEPIWSFGATSGSSSSLTFHIIKSMSPRKKITLWYLLYHIAISSSSLPD